MTDEILPIPSIPDSLRDAARQGTLVPFIGSGVSQLAGCPGWGDFADAALLALRDKKLLNEAQLSLLGQLPGRVRLSIAVDMERRAGSEIDFARILQAPDDERREMGERVYESLSRFARVFVTTNYDDWLDKVRAPLPAVNDDRNMVEGDVGHARSVLYRLEDLTASALLGSSTVLHIHGSILDRKSMVLTTADYLKRYAGHPRSGPENTYRTFLERLFSHMHVLFIGYSLSELEILEYVLQSARNDGGAEGAPQETPRHFLLWGFFSHEAALASSLTNYYQSQLGVRLLPYSRDRKNWKQLADVIDHLALQIPVSGALALEERRMMEALLEQAP